MDANDQKCGVEGTEGTPCKKHTIEQSPRKPSPAKKPKIQQHQRQATTNVTMLENRITKLEMNSEKGLDALRKNLYDQRTFLASKLDKKLDQDAAMNDKEHESFITDIAKTATRAYLRKILDDKVKDIVDDLVEDILYEKLAQRDAVLARLLKDRNAAIKSMLAAEADQLELDEELAGMRRFLAEQRRKLDTMWGWIRTLSDAM